MSFEGIEISFEVKDVIKFSGKVAFKQATDDQFFLGRIALELPSINLKAAATLLIGYDKKVGFPYWYIYLDVALPVGIPLFASGAALYGLTGLVADNMDAKKSAEQNWVEWYKAAPVGVNDPQKKWMKRKGAFAFGAGMALGTVFDDGFSINARAMLVLIFPGPILMLDGQASFLKKRGKGTGPGKKAGMFHALAVFDGRAGDFRLNLDAQYQLPEGSGAIIDISLGAEAYFNFNDASKWHLYLGEKPKPKRIRAKIIKLFEANGYFMIDPKALQFGAFVGYDAKWTWGPVSLVLQAWISGDGKLSFEPVHFQGTLWLHGAFKLSIFGFGFGISADARVSVATPTPWHILIELALKIDLPWPLPDIEAKAKLEWKEPKPLPTPDPLRHISIGHDLLPDTWPLVKYDGLPSDEAKISDTAPVVPLDARPLLSFAHPVGVDEKIIFTQNQPANPAPEAVGEQALRYDLAAVTLYKRANGYTGRWTIVSRRTVLPRQRNQGDLYGVWLAQTGPDKKQPAQPSPTKLKLWGRTPFLTHTQATQAWADAYETRFPFAPCGPEPDTDPTCVTFGVNNEGRVWPDAFTHDGLQFALTRGAVASRTPLRILACEGGRAHG